jgi:hypothetical protein
MNIPTKYLQIIDGKARNVDDGFIKDNIYRRVSIMLMQGLEDWNCLV